VYVHLLSDPFPTIEFNFLLIDDLC
jgi:hypothetical protein